MPTSLYRRSLDAMTPPTAVVARRVSGDGLASAATPSRPRRTAPAPSNVWNGRFDDDVRHELGAITGRDLDVVDTTGFVTGS